MKVKIVSFLTILISGFFIISSCNKSGSSVTNISATGGNKSHNMGENCMNCHKSGGKGEGWFNVAGTVYNSALTSTYANTTVKLYTGPNGTGTVKYTIYGDAKGNFYTTETIDFGSGLYPAVEGTNGAKYMSSAITSGQCNSCHGSSTNRLWTN